MLHQASQPEVRRTGRAVCRMTCWFLLLAGPTVGVCQADNRLSDEVNTIELTDRVLVQDTVRFGINLGGDAYYSGAALVKKRVQENFEGTSYRPTFLACAAANRAMGGDLVETVHFGADPTFSATGVFQNRKGAETIGSIPEIFSYGFADGAKRGLILVNLSTNTSHRIALKFNARAASASARSWLLSADSITDHNEFEVAEPQVALRAERIEDFQSGWQSRLPPFSMRVLAWEVEP